LLVFAASGEFSCSLLRSEAILVNLE